FLVPGDVLVLGGDAELAFRRVLERAAPPVAQSAPASPAPAAASAAAAPSAAAAAAPSTPATQAESVDRQAPAETAVSASAAPESPAVDAAAHSPAQTLVALQFQDGTTVPIHGIGYIGRAPSLPDGERP